MVVAPSSEMPDDEAVDDVHVGQDAVESARLGGYLVSDLPVAVVVGRQADKRLVR